MLKRIRNLTVRALPSGTLFPQEITQYDPWVIREALHNCIAHQDYGLHGRIVVVEFPASILLSNVGRFPAGDVETVIRQDAPLEIYRNPFLADAMVELNMIDTQGGGHQAHVRDPAPALLPPAGLRSDRAGARGGDDTAAPILDEQYSPAVDGARPTSTCGR